jgi:hypothetical protein
MKELRASFVVFLALLLFPFATHAVEVNFPPVAVATSNSPVQVGEPAALDGSGSTDQDGIVLGYTWSWVSKPEGSNAEFVDAVAQITSFTPDMAGFYEVQLVVVDDGGAFSDPVTVTVEAVGGEPTIETVITTIEELQAYIASLPPRTFRYVLAKRLLHVELNFVIASLEMGRYRIALLLLKNNILPVTDGCFKIGVPERNDWIVDCGVQTTVYAELQEIIAMVKEIM